MTKKDASAAYRLIIIGGGAAGLYAGAVSQFLCPDLPEGQRGIILERRPEPGKKLMISGAGQCNLTHGGSVKDFPPHYHEAGKKIRTLLYAHSNSQVSANFARMGVRTFEREDGKIFPKTLSARKVRDALISRCEKNGFPILTGAECTGLTPFFRFRTDCSFEENRALPYSSSGDDFSDIPAARQDSIAARWKVVCGRREYRAHSVLITTGGASVPKTGSDGTFLRILENLGIPSVPLTPALTPVFVQQYPFRSLSGISFSDAHITVLGRDGKKKIDRRGPLLLTHEAFSGPCVIDSSRYIETGDSLIVSWNADLPASVLLHRLTDAASKSKISASSHLAGILKEAGFPVPQRFLDLQLLRCGTDPTRKAAQIGKKTWSAILRTLTEDVYSVSGKGGFSSAMATRGGVSLDAVDLKTMESKRYPGLYFAGEVLDVDGDTGGYNLQFAFSSAACAVKSIFLHGQTL